MKEIDEDILQDKDLNCENRVKEAGQKGPQEANIRRSQLAARSDRSKLFSNNFSSDGNWDNADGSINYSYFDQKEIGNKY